jgi:hypothetical protein
MEFTVRDNAMKKAIAEAVGARNMLTTVIGNRNFAKVCCVCDKFVMYGEECTVCLHVLESQKVKRMLRKDRNWLKTHYKLSEDAIDEIFSHYIVKCSDKEAWLREMYLSPKSYFKGVIGNKNYGLGACRVCKTALMYGRTKNEVEDKPPKYAIANGLMIGGTPNVLMKLNDVANDVLTVSKMVNWCAENSDGNENETNEMLDREEAESDTTETISEEGKSEEEKVKMSKFAKICVILCGPFTATQRVIARKKTEVNWAKVQLALQWLTCNNHLYASLKIDKTDLQEPTFIEKFETAESEDNNIETIFEFRVYFPDGSDMNNLRSEFKELTLERMLAESDNREATLVNRPTTTILNDYQGDNLMMAFPLQFPYGVGSKDKDNETRRGVRYIQHLMSLGRLPNHRSDFVCVLHNMFERNRMIRNSLLRNPETLREGYEGLTNEGISEAVD